MKSYKLLASIILIILTFNILSGIIYSIKAEYIENATENNISTELQNNITDETEENTTNNETVENTTDNETSNEIANNTTENTTNNTINNTINNTVENQIEENTISNEVNNTTNNVIENEQENEITTLSEDSNEIGVSYQTHVEMEGWQDFVQNGEMSGTEGKCYRLEAIKINLLNAPTDLNIKYQVHVENIGWQDWKSNGEMAGTQGKAYRLEGIKIRLESSQDYSIMYRVHVQNLGWQDWKTDGEMAGTQGQALRLEAIQIKIVPKLKKTQIDIESPKNGQTFYYEEQTSIKVTGWKMSNLSNTKIRAYIDGSEQPIDNSLITYTKRNDILSSVEGYGTSIENPTPGFEFNIDITGFEAGTHTVKVVLLTQDDEQLKEISKNFTIDKSLHIKYKSHVQTYGWQDYVLDGNLSGTSGQSLRVEAMNIELLGAPEDAKVLYRTHVQNIGWQNWVENGAMAGTQGQSLRIEAIEIKLENMNDYTVEYQVHVQDIGWTDWYIDGETAGTIGRQKRIEAIRIRLVPKYKREYLGIDVSQFNYNVNWDLVKRAGYEFAMIRVGIRGYGAAGNFREDSNFRANIEGAKNAGLKVGVYFVTQAITDAEAIQEADWVYERIKQYDIDYPVAIDIEAPGLEDPSDIPRTQNLDRNTRTRLAKIFCQRIQSLGYTPIIYCNVDWATNYLNMSELSEYDTWIANYTYDINSKPNYNGKYSMWQYTNTGFVNGISGRVDLNVCYKNY